MKEQILNYITQIGGYVTFAELSNHIEGFASDYAWGNADTNIFFWFSFSNEAIDAILALWAERKIKLGPAQYLTYLIDGAIPKAPIAKQNRSYKTERWMPVVLNLPHQEGWFNDKMSELHKRGELIV